MHSDTCISASLSAASNSTSTSDADVQYSLQVPMYHRAQPRRCRLLLDGWIWTPTRLSSGGGGRHAVRCCLPAATAGDADVPTGGASLWFVVGGRSRVPTIRPAVGQSERGRLGQGTEEEENKTECRCALWPSDGWAAPAGRSRANSKEISLAHENLRRV